jgi:DNA-binding transcriptional LysR family regulator
MTLDLRLLQTFVAVVETTSFHEAARRCGRSQPAISQQIRKLEVAVGAPLIERRAVGCAPTPAGARLLPFARSLLRTEQRAIEAVRSPGAVIGASSNIGIYLLPPQMAAWRATNTTPMSLEIGANPAVADRLAQGEIDLALLEWWDDRPGLIAEPWRTEPLIVIVAPDHPWARAGGVDVATLAAVPLLGGEPGSGSGRLLRDSLGVPTTSAVQLGSTEAVKRAVRAGLGVSIVMGATVADELAAGGLVGVSIDGAVRPLQKTLYVARHRDAPPTSAAVGFTRFLIDELSA